MDVEAAVEQALRMPVAPRMPRVGLRMRLHTSPSIRRLVPRPAALAAAERKGEQLWRRQAYRDRATAMMENILARTERAGEVAELARLRVIDEEVMRAMFWSPWRYPPPSEASTRTIQEVIASRRPLLFSGCHLGPYFQQFSSLPRCGVKMISVSGGWFFDDPPADLWGRRLARWSRGVIEAGLRLTPAAGSVEPVRRLLEMGEPVGTYFDMPGSARTTFLGKPVDLASGTSQLGHQTGALLVPLRTHREGMLVHTEVLEPLDAARFATPLELHNALAAVHERSILAYPHTLEDPGRPGSWEGGATPASWLRPDAG